MSKISSITLSAVIACYKDGEAIPVMHKRLTDVFTKIGCNYEIIFSLLSGLPSFTKIIS